MKRLITFVLCALLLLGLVAPMASATTFGDVPAGEWFAPYVRWANVNGIMQGTGGGNFSPNAPMTRAQLVTILWRIDGEPAPTYNADFSDVASEQWYTNAVNWAASRGIVGGVGSGRFAPHDNITREQFAAILHRWAMGMWYLPNDLPYPTVGAISHFHDRHLVSEWAVSALEVMVTFGVMGGTSSTTLAPQGIATRAQGAAMIARLAGVSHEYSGQAMPVPPMDTQPTPPEPPTSPPAHEFELEVLRLINMERANAGLRPLIWDDSLAAVAQSHAVDMATRGFFSHTCPDGRGSGDRIANGTRFMGGGENIARGFPTPESVVAGWMNSTGHRNLILVNFTEPIYHNGERIFDGHETFGGVGFYRGHWVLKVGIAP